MIYRQGFFNCRFARFSSRATHQSGDVVVEFVAVAIFLVIAALVGVNCCIPLFAAWTNDAACRDAARAASLQQTAAQAQQAAQATVSRFATAFCNITLSTSGNDFQYQTFPDPATGQPQMNLGPYVKVTTILTVQLPVILTGMGNHVNLKQSYIFPLNPS